MGKFSLAKNGDKKWVSFLINTVGVDRGAEYSESIKPSNAEATFIQSTRTQRFLKTI